MDINNFLKLGRMKKGWDFSKKTYNVQFLPDCIIWCQYSWSIATPFFIFKYFFIFSVAFLLHICYTIFEVKINEFKRGR